MIDLYLRAADEAAMLTALAAAGFTVDDGLNHPDATVHIIGTLRNVVDELTVVTVPGYHVNVRTESAELAVALEPLAVYPKTPSYVWA